nr:hypothetical protein [Tanacetum cinerariifolium]
TLFRDRPDHRRTAMLMDREAMYAREALAFSMDRSSAIAAHNVMRTGAGMAMSFQGTKGVVGLTRWLEKMESVFRISNCTIACQVKFASCTLQGSALTCPRGEIQKLESEYWILKVKDLDLLNYNHRFHELALMCERMFPEEAAKVERYIGDLPDMIHGSVKASKPLSMQEAITFATEIMDKKILTHAEHQAE